MTGKGYPPAYGYGPNGPSTATAPTKYAGGSHGGRGGYKSDQTPADVKFTYGDYRDPKFPGAGGKVAGYGGGIVRITSNNPCTINNLAPIISNGYSSNSSFKGAAGGSIYLKCNGFGGNAVANALQANGINAFATAYHQGAGGGGCIAEAWLTLRFDSH